MKKKMRVWWMPQVGVDATFYIPIKSIEEAKKFIDILSAYDCFKYNHHIKPDYCNTGGVQVWDEEAQEWIDWHYEDEDSFFVDIDEYCDEILQQINENADLVSYVSQTLELEQRGDEFFAHCPKHIDNTPSLAFNKDKNLYYCFSCGRSGGIIGYLIEYEGLSFEDAVKKATKLADIDLSNLQRKWWYR